MKGVRSFWPRFGQAAHVGLSAAAVLLLLASLAAGCGGGGESTSTTTVSTGGGETTTVTSPSTSATTAGTAPTTTSVTGPSSTSSTTSSTELATTTTTTEALSSAETRLANGHIKAMGYIDKVYVKDGKRYISIDYAQMLTGAAATKAAIADGVIPPGGTLDNDYYISNVNPQKRVFEVSNSVAITTSTRWVPGEDMNAPCTWSDFKSFWGPAAALDSSEKHLHEVPWWIERDGPVVVKIDEQYLP